MKPRCACGCHELKSKRAARVEQLVPQRLSTYHNLNWCGEYERLGQVVADKHRNTQPRETHFIRLDGWKERKYA